jgi:ankyrin repeat protein
LDDQVDRDSIKNFPLALYTAQYWATHARFENASSWIKNGMECLFDADKPHFATWLWIYNEDQDGRSMSTMCPEKPEAVPLYYAARLGIRDLAEHLIAEHPEHVNVRGGVRGTPMHAAAIAGHVDILSLLFEHGADPEGRNTLDGTPLHQASYNGMADAQQYLLDRGANIDVWDNIGFIPLFFAVNIGRVECVRMLLERGARTDGPHDQIFGGTVLHFGVRRGNIEVVRLLLEHGADVNAPDRRGKTPSQSTELQEILELLSQYGAKSGE